MSKSNNITKLDIRFLNPSKTFDKQIAALGRVPTSKIFPDPKVRPVDEVVTDVQFRNTNIKNNPEQKIAFENIIKRYSACQPLCSTPYVVHGPPGTGKSTTLLEVIYQMIR